MASHSGRGEGVSVEASSASSGAGCGLFMRHHVSKTMRVCFEISKSKTRPV